MQPGERSPADQILDEKIVTKDDGSLRVLHGTARRDGFTTQDFVKNYLPTQTDQDSGKFISQFDRQNLEPFVGAKTAGEFLHYSAGSIKQMARDGRISAHPFGSGVRKRWYFLISELAEYLRAQVNSAHGEAGRDKTQRRSFESRSPQGCPLQHGSALQGKESSWHDMGVPLERRSKRPTAPTQRSNRHNQGIPHPGGGKQGGRSVTLSAQRGQTVLEPENHYLWGTHQPRTPALVKVGAQRKQVLH